MNISRPYKNRKTKGQTMVEFALALPLLLTLIYGLLETGRLLFIYASTVTAARQAVRYGSATGDSPNGMPYYRDCAGIEAAVDNVGIINDFDTIDITYDAGVDSANGNSLPLNPANPACGSFTSPANGNRIIVTVTTLWEPIVPLVPLDPITITSQSERTILASVSIAVTSVQQGWIPSNNGILSLSISASPATYSTVGETITYTYQLSNVGTGDLSAPFTVTDTIAATSCAGAPATLAGGASFNCTGTYHITQADLDAGTVVNKATADANGTATDQVQKTITVNALPALTLSISPSQNTAPVNTSITYTYTLKNTGNVSITSPYAVSDNSVSPINCSGAASPLAPGASTTCTGSRSITNGDVTNGTFTNQAVATAKYKTTTTVTSNNATATVYTTSLVLFITNVSPITATLPNQVITYSYLVKNNSAVGITSLSISDTKATGITCTKNGIITTTIAAGDSLTCTGTYTVTLTDFNTGTSIANSATAHASNGTAITSNTTTASFGITQTATVSAAVSASPALPVAPATTIPAGTTITYTYVLTNTGNVTLTTPIAVTDNQATITCSDQTAFVPLATRNCTGTHVVTAGDASAGSIVNTGTATAKFGAATVTSNTATATVITNSAASFSLTLSASPPTITQANTSIVFTYTITNTGGKTLTSPYSITSSIGAIGTFSCAGASPLVPGASTSCQNSYTSTNTVVNTITAASAKDGAATVTAASLPTLTVPSNICSAGTLTLGAPSSSGSTVSWVIANGTGSPLTINSITVQWNTSGSKYLSSAELPVGTTIWSGTEKTGIYTISGSYTLGTGNTTLHMNFTKNAITITSMSITFVESGCGPIHNP